MQLSGFTTVARRESKLDISRGKEKKKSKKDKIQKDINRFLLNGKKDEEPKMEKGQAGRWGRKQRGAMSWKPKRSEVGSAL